MWTIVTKVINDKFKVVINNEKKEARNLKYVQENAKSRTIKPKRKTGWENLEENSHLIKFAAKRDFTHLTSKMAPYRVFPLKPGKKQEDNILFIEDAGR